MIEDTAADYTDAVLLRELTDALTTKFERSVLDAKANYWIHPYDVALTSGQESYRLPPRAIGISKIEIAQPNPNTSGWVRLPQTSENNIDRFQTPKSAIDTPQRWVLRGDEVILYPTPDNGGYTLRIWYYVRPSRLVPVQTTAGFVIAINQTAPSLFVFSAPFGFNSDGTQIVLTAANPVDVIAPGAWHELKLVSQLPLSVVGQTWTFPAGTDLSDVKLGDVLRYEDNTDWPQIPEDYHRTLVDIASVKVLIQRDFQQKAVGYAQDANADMQRFLLMIAQRVQEEPAVFRADLPSLRFGRYYSGGGYGP